MAHGMPRYKSGGLGWDREPRPRPATAADRPSVTDDARAEAIRTGHPLTSLLACTRCGVLLWNIDTHYQHAHPEAAGRAETTTATTEDAAQAVADVIYNGDATMPGATRIAALLHERGLLATARTRPTREQVAKVLARHDGKPVATTTDAVLALLADQPETTTEWGVRSEWAPTTGHFDHEHDARAFAARIEGRAVVRREVTAWIEAGQ